MAADVCDLVRRAQGGDVAAFEDLLTAFQRPVFYMVLRVVGDYHTADDVTQDVFIKAYDSLKELNTPEHFKSWLYRIAMNRAIDIKRVHASPRGEVPIEDFSTFGQADPDPTTDGEEVGKLRSAIEKAIAELPASQKSVLTLTVEQGLAQEEIARILECPVGTVKSRLHHARRYIKAKIERLIGPL